MGILITKMHLASHVVRVCKLACAHICACVKKSEKKRCRLFNDIFDRIIQIAKANLHTLAILQHDETERGREWKQRFDSLQRRGMRA